MRLTNTAVSDSEESDNFEKPKLKKLKKNQSDSDTDDETDEEVKNSSYEPRFDKKSPMKTSIKRARSASDCDEDKGVESECLHDLECISSDCEVFTLQCPHDVDMSSLIGTTLTNLNPGDGLSVQNISFTKGPLNVSCIVSKQQPKLISVPLQGHLVVRKHSRFPVTVHCSTEDDQVEFPSQIIQRHPLLGASWQDAIQESTAVLKKHKKHTSDNELTSPDRKKKKKRKHDKSIVNILIQDHVTKRKKKDLKL